MHEAVQVADLQPLNTLKDNQVALRRNHGLNLDICLVGNQNLHANGAICPMRLCDDRKRMRDKCVQKVSLLTMAALPSSTNFQMASNGKHWLPLEAAAAAALTLQQHQLKTAKQDCAYLGSLANTHAYASN